MSANRLSFHTVHIFTVETWPEYKYTVTLPEFSLENDVIYESLWHEDFQDFKANEKCSQHRYRRDR